MLLENIEVAAKSETRPHSATPPETIVLDWTDYCNLKCMFCWRDEFEKQNGSKGDFISFEKIEMLERPLRAAKYLVISSGIGEPLLHPDLDELLQWIYEINPKILLRIVTNGTTLTSEKAKLFAGHLDWLSVSLNATNAEAYMRDMYPHDYKKGVDGTARWNYFIRRLTAFIAALPENDRKRIRIQGVLHRDNIADMSDFVRLTGRMGASQAVITPMHIRRAEQLNLSIYWSKDLYNDTVDEAMIVGTEIGVRVEAARFYTNPKLVEVDLDKICREPLDFAYISKGELAAPCCHWTDTHIPCDVYSDADGFERFWNHDIFRRLREKRNSRSCQVCEITRVFDEVGSHIAPMLRRELSDSGRISELDNKGFYTDIDLVRAGAKFRVDLPSLRRTLLRLNVPVDKLRAIETNGLAALPALDRLCWDAFCNADSPVGPLDIPLAGCFAGIGWGAPIHEPQNAVSARWIGGSQIASVFVRVSPGAQYRVLFTIHNVSPARLGKKLKLAVGESLIETTLSLDKTWRMVLVGIVPRRLVDAHGGRLWLRIGCFESDEAQLAGHVSIARVQVEEFQDQPVRHLARALWRPLNRCHVMLVQQVRSIRRTTYDLSLTLLWRPLKTHQPALASKIRGIIIASPITRYIRR
ncbi:MAG: radical SAM protein [Bradyrhizobium sp.]